MDPISNKKGKIEFYSVRVNGQEKEISEIQTVLPPSGTKHFWTIGLEDGRSILATGNIDVEYGPKDEIKVSVQDFSKAK